MGSARCRNRRVRKAVWEKENELRFRDAGCGKSGGSLDGEVSGYLKCAIEVL